MGYVAHHDQGGPFGPQPLVTLFTGEHAWCAEKIRETRDMPDAQPLGTFFRSGGFAAALDRMALGRGGADRRALASFWSLYYFAALTIPYLVARRANQALPVALDAMTLTTDEEGLPRAFGLADAGAISDVETDDLPTLVTPLVTAHLREAVALMQEHGKLAPKLAWNNAAVYIDYAFNATALTARNESVDGQDHWAASDLFHVGTLADGSVNPFRGCLRHEQGPEGTPLCRRRVCCMRYLLPGVASCGELCALPEQRQRSLEQSA
ncbi:siderophore-iron reductase FhuF [Xaviernesmea oryzae]|uniref:Siderophore-iron reductase FhuF n=1 Tax=Xaviernesmea oryzae TaxID=464029 RepID=A0A1Q9AZV8_9HYPH|nr:siderophore-iron reductase FhuF [Xaviernesmea oryzae]OLP61255.1 siderophore-iron reductase FhuF [Xaviernesmea oryzae]SEL52271.1 ferric iron reductase protein FhuF [Xaviernesmea oryzae]